MPIDFNALEIGGIYEIDKDAIRHVPEDRIRVIPGQRIGTQTNPLRIAQAIKYSGLVVYLRINSKINDTLYNVSYLNSQYQPLRMFGSPTEYSFSKLLSRFVPLKSRVVDTVNEKSKVQAVKDVLAQRGVPETSDTGPLSNILRMAGIKAPPKQSGVGRRKTRKSKKSKRKTHKRK